MADEKKASGLFTKEKDFVDKNLIRELKESYQQAEKNGSLQWKFVGSFDNEWLKKKIRFWIRIGAVQEQYAQRKRSVS